MGNIQFLSIFINLFICNLSVMKRILDNNASSVNFDMFYCELLTTRHIGTRIKYEMRDSDGDDSTKVRSTYSG